MKIQRNRMLKSYPLEDRQRLLGDLKRDLSHTVFGSKPATLLEGPTSSGLFVVNVASRHTLNPKFSIVQLPSGLRVSGECALVFNNDAVRKTIVQNPEIFGLHPAPSPEAIEDKLAELCTPDGARVAVSNDVTLGTLLGFGAGNARKFAEPWESKRFAIPDGSGDDTLGANATIEIHTVSNNMFAVGFKPDGLVQPFGVKMWDSAETTRLGNQNVDTAYAVNERLDAMHAQVVKFDPKAKKEDTLVLMALDELFGSSK